MTERLFSYYKSKKCGKFSVNYKRSAILLLLPVIKFNRFSDSTVWNRNRSQLPIPYIFRVDSVIDSTENHLF